MDKKIVAVIPARMASSRFPGKPLADISGLPMIEHVRRRVSLAKAISEVVVATCDQEIKSVVESYGGTAVMTADTHERSSDRVAEAMQEIPGDVVINAQGDEPLLLPADLESVYRPFFDEENVDCVSLLSPLEEEADYTNQNIVKAACDRFDRVIYLTRAAIPYRMKAGQAPVYRETGIRAFKADFLQTYVALSETPFERVESVDMMRVIEHGYRIHSALAEKTTIGVDHKEDVALVEKILASDPNQMRLHRMITQE